LNRFDNHFKKNLVNINKNIYINPSDPLYCEKVIRYIDPHSPEAHYMLGQKHEQKNSFSTALFHYKKAARFHSPYYLKAKHSIIEIENKLQGRALEQSSSTNPSRSHIPMFVKSLIVFLLLFNILLLLFMFGSNPIRSTVSSVKQWTIGMDVVYESIDVPYTFYLPFDEPIDQIEKTLYHKAVEMGKDQPNQNLQLYGILTTDQKLLHKVLPLTNHQLKEKAFVIVEYHSTLDQSVKIRFLNAEFQKEQQGPLPLTFVSANLVRTALQSYIEEEGGPPTNIKNLMSDYPNNYISFIPNEAMSGKNQVLEKYDGQGGWVYNRLADNVSTMFYPNIPEYINDPSTMAFKPLEIVVLKEDFSLIVLSGSYIIASKQVGLGMDNLTPEGSFIIEERVLEPIGKQPDIFGMAGLGMGDIAIHGTYDNNSIKNYQSLGCIRLTNKDIMDIFHFIPKGTIVTIKERGLSSQNYMTLLNTEIIIPSYAPQIDQSTDTIFYWLD
jgi:hypothetical protein